MNVIDKIINYAISQIGTKESPAGSNKVKYNTWYYGKEVSGSAYPWCAVFICYLFSHCKLEKLFCGGSKVAYCPSIENYYKSKNRYYPKTQGKRGDLCLMDFGKGRASHIGIVEKKNSDGSYTVIEGNTSTSSNDNGGCVMRRTRNIGVIRGFARPYYGIASSSTTNTKINNNSSTYSKKQFVKEVQLAVGVKTDGVVGKKTLSKLVTVSKSKNNKHKVIKPLQKYLNEIGYSCGKVDGEFGSKTESAVKKFQKAKKLTSDGIVGMNTWKKLLGV